MQYSIGTVAVTHDSATVVGTGTQFLLVVQVGHSFKLDLDSVVYTIAAVVSDTQLTLSVPWQGLTGSLKGYSVGISYTPNFNLYEVSASDKDWAAHLTQNTIRKIDNLLRLTPGVTRTGIVAPTALTPACVGEVYQNTVTGITYVANTVTVGGYKEQVGVVATQTLTNKTLTAPVLNGLVALQGLYNNALKLGAYYFWMSAAGKYFMKSTAPASETDGFVIPQQIEGSVVYDPPSIAIGGLLTTTLVVSGCAMGDYVQASFSLDLQGITLTAYVSVAGTVTFSFFNGTTTAKDLASGTLRARVTKQ